MDLLASGRDSDVYAFTDGLVLRRYRDGRKAHDEAELLRKLRRRGYPVPRIESDAGPDIVMERIVGPNLAEAMQSNSIGPAAGAQLLAKLHDRLHALTHGLEDPMLHLDLHPANVLLAENGPVVIDWTNARRGPAALDIAMTALILAQVIVTPGMVSSDPTADAAAQARTPALLAAFVTAVSADYVNDLDQALSLRLHNASQSPTELALLPKAAALARSVTSPPRPTFH